MRFFALLLAAVLLAEAPLRADDCSECKAERLCAPHQKEEDDTFKEWAPLLESDEASDRLAAMRAIASLTGDHESLPSLRVAKALQPHVQDRSLRVRSTAIELLIDGQNRKIAVEGLLDALGVIKSGLAGQSASTDLVPRLVGYDAGPEEIQGAMDYLRRVLRIAGEVKDERTAKIMTKIIRDLPFEMRGQPVALAACRTALEYGTPDCVEAVVKSLNPWEDTRGVQKVHDALEQFAFEHDIKETPEWNDDCPKAWRKWLQRYKRRLPKKLGRWDQRKGDSEDDGR